MGEQWGDLRSVAPPTSPRGHKPRRTRHQQGDRLATGWAVRTTFSFEDVPGIFLRSRRLTFESRLRMIARFGGDLSVVGGRRRSPVLPGSGADGFVASCTQLIDEPFAREAGGTSDEDPHRGGVDTTSRAARIRASCRATSASTIPWIMSSNETVVCQSRTERALLDRRYGLDPALVFVTPIAVADRWRPLAAVERSRRHLTVSARLGEGPFVRLSPATQSRSTSRFPSAGCPPGPTRCAAPSVTFLDSSSCPRRGDSWLNRIPDTANMP